MAVWRNLEKKYLTPLEKPIWMDQKDYDEHGYSRSSVPPFGDKPNPLQEVWDLFRKDDVSRQDKIILGTTFDNVVVMKENLQDVIDAFENFEFDTSLKEQAKIFREALEDDDLIGVAWNQTSVSADTWTNFNYDEEKEESIPYNLNEQKEHWSLFDEVK